jgi:hypothetical protein
MTEKAQAVAVALAVVFAVSAGLIAVALVTRPPATASGRVDHEARSRELAWAQAAKLALIQDHTITKFDCAMHEVQADGLAWAAVPLDTKKTAVETLSRICLAETRLGHVTVIDNRSGRTLAAFSSWSGVTLR